LKRRRIPMAALFQKTYPKLLEEMTWQEVAEKLEKTKTVLIAMGSTEAHGLHLPLSSDTWQGVEIVKRVAAQLEKKGITVVPGPVIPYGICPPHTDFPGSLDFKPETILTIVVEICTSLYKYGFRNFYLVIAHGGNLGIMHTAAQEIVKRLEGSKAALLNWLGVMSDKYPEILTSKKVEGHSGEGETSRMLVTSPDLCEMGRAKAYYPEGYEKPVQVSRYNKKLYLGGGLERASAHFKTTTPTATIGDPHLATKETGEKLYTVICDWICSILEQDLK
jgi:creatinine amidohydrolase